MKKELVKEEILRLLKEGHEITVSWDCGGDDKTINVYIDNQVIETRYWDSEVNDVREREKFIVNGIDSKIYPKFDWDMYRLLIEKVDILELADYSRPHREGKGKIIYHDDMIILEFKNYRKIATEGEEEENIELFEKLPDFSNLDERRPNKKLEIPLAETLLFKI